MLAVTLALTLAAEARGAEIGPQLSFPLPVGEVGDHQLVAFLRVKRPDLCRKPCNILIALFQESIGEGDQFGIRDCRSVRALRTHGHSLVVRVKKAAEP